MADLQRNSAALFIVVFTCSFYLLCLLQPTEANSMVEGLKAAEGSLSNGGSGIRNGLSGGGNGASGLFGNRRNLRSIYGLGPKMLQISRSKIPIELDLLVENEDGDRSKRFDDYGHMRFGKRGGEEQFDDYGHMRFGRSA